MWTSSGYIGSQFWADANLFPSLSSFGPNYLCSVTQKQCLEHVEHVETTLDSNPVTRIVSRNRMTSLSIYIEKPR